MRLPYSYIEATECINRANLITERLQSAKGPKEIAVEIAKALRVEISQLPRSREYIETNPFPHVPYPWLSSKTVKEFLIFDCDPLQGLHLLENLVDELIATYASPRPTDENGKRNRERPSFAFFVSALSALAKYQEPDDDFMIICEAARDAAAAIAAAAIYKSLADTLGDLQRGAQVVADFDYIHGIFSRHVAAAIKAHRNLVEKGALKITKADVRREATRLLLAVKITAHKETDSARWREIYQAAGLGTLPQERAKRGPSKHRKG